MTDDTVVRLTISLVSILVGVVVSAQSQQQCSPFCACDSWYGLQRASCTGRHLNSIDTSAPDSVQALDLSDNVISLLSNYELMNAGRAKLKYLNLSGNSISEIDLDAFSGLNDLTVLDLSMNHLYYILSDIFVNNNNLRVLKLSKNNFNSQVPRLQSSSLTELSLDSCQISHLPLDTFNGLTHVRRLDLSNNLMIQMSSTVVQTLHLLRKLSLEGYDNLIQNRTDSDGSLIESCPGTPPPPYREVMLRPNIYRCPSAASNLNNNGTGYR